MLVTVIYCWLRSVSGSVITAILLHAVHNELDQLYLQPLSSNEKVPYYAVEDKFPFGHGEKSVFLIERFIRLKPAEAMAIRWHMGGFDEAARGGSFAISVAYEKYPLAIKLHLADLESTYLKEKHTSVMR